jgi:glycine/D-amino acid oxidase-like deaminating enzyme
MNFDIVIVGNGAIGHAIAHALANDSPSLKVAILGESSRPYGASPAAGAMLGAFSETTATLSKSVAGRAKMEESRRAAKLWPDWLAGLNEQVASSSRVSIRPGTFVIHNSVGGVLDTDNYAAIRQALQDCDEPFQDVEPVNIEGLAPWAMARPLRAMYIPREGSVESDRLLAAYVEAADASTAIKIIDDRAMSVETSGSYVTGVRTARSGLLSTKRIVLANGVCTQGLLDQLPSLARRIPRLFCGGGTSLVLDPNWCYGGKSAAIVPHVVRTPNRSFACGLHMVPRGDSHIYIGATNYLSIKPWSNPNLSDMHFLIDCAVEQLNQNFVWSQLVSWHTGNRPVTIDSCPIVGATSLEGLWIVSGSFRDGLHMSPLLAQQICREIIYEQHVTPHMFRPERPPISISKEEAIAEIIMHSEAAWSEHRAVNSTKMGLHYELPSWLGAAAENFYAKLDSPYVLPPEFFTLADSNPETLELFRSYYAETQAAWT